MATFRRSRVRTLTFIVDTHIEVKVPRRLSLRQAKRATRRFLPHLLRQVRRRRALHRRALKLPLEHRSREELLAEFFELLSRALSSLSKEGVRVEVRERLRYAWAYVDLRKREVRVSALCRVLPRELLRYVAVHEACHFLSPRHDEAFWSCVERVYPGYEQIRELLKLYSIRLKRSGVEPWTA